MGGSLSNVQLFADKQMMKGTVLWFPSSDAGDERVERGLSTSPFWGGLRTPTFHGHDASVMVVLQLLRGFL